MGTRVNSRSCRVAATGVGCLAALLWNACAFAGPPFRTDDPEPVEYQRWEFTTFAQGTHVSGDTSGTFPGFNIDEHNHMLFSAGRALQNAAETNLFSFDVAYQSTN